MRFLSRLTAAILLLAPLALHAQWTSSAGNTTTTDKVAIGSNAPPAKQLEVFGQALFSDRVGIGLPAGSTPDSFLQVYGNWDGAVTVRAQNASATGLTANAILSAKADVSDVQLKSNSTARTLVRFDVPIGGWNELAGISGNGLIVGTVNNTPLIFGTTASRRMTITPAGDVGIGVVSPVARLHVVGNAQFDGTVTGTFIKAHYQDVAEWVPAKNDLAAGTVVVLDQSVGNAIMASSRAYDTTVAGVVSAQPGIILGEEGASKEQVATTGRVRVKVDATAGPIAVGDLLVTSDRAGYAMRSTPIDVGGALLHRPGTIVGKALEALASGQGEILVLLSLQ